MLGRLLSPEIDELIRNREFHTLKGQLADWPAADIADLVEELSPSQVPVVYRLLPKEKATEVFEHLDVDEQRILLESLSHKDVQHILEEMSVDDRTALLDELPPEVAAQMLALLPEKERALVQTILNYPEYSVGRLITPDYITLTRDMSVQQALDRIRRFGKDKETVYVCYVIEKGRKLEGYVTLRKIVTSPLETPIAELLDPNPIKLHSDTEQEEAVETFRRYDVLSLPVVDSEDHMVGIVTFDDIMDVAEEEYQEDMDLMAAVMPGDSDRNYLEEKLLSAVGRRVPWLMALLLVEGAAVLILSRYNELLDLHIALSFFLPALIATGGNTGTQSSSMVIRALAVGHVTIKDIGRILGRALASGLILAVILGTSACVMALVIKRDMAIGLCVAIGLAVVVVLSNIAGSVLPLVLKRVKLDPALMSSPFISTLVDIFGLVIYMEISRRILT